MISPEFFELDGKVIIADEIMEKGKTSRGGWRGAQIIALGGEWPLIAGWKGDLIGTAHPQETVQDLIRLGGDDPEAVRDARKVLREETAPARAERNNARRQAKKAKRKARRNPPSRALSAAAWLAGL